MRELLLAVVVAVAFTGCKNERSAETVAKDVEAVAENFGKVAGVGCTKEKQRAGGCKGDDHNYYTCTVIFLDKTTMSFRCDLEKGSGCRVLKEIK